MKGQDVLRPSAALLEGAEPPVGEDARDEVVAKPGVGQAAFFLYGREGIGVHETPREEAAPASRGEARFRVDLHALHAARGRRALEDVARESECSEVAHARPRIGVHGVRQVCPALGGHEPRPPRVSDEADRLAGDAQPQLHLRTHRDPGEMAREGARDIRVFLMTAVVADGFPEQAGGDADLDLEVGRSPGGG